MWGNLQFWMRCLSEIFLRHSQDISGLFTDHFEFLLCLSVCQLAYFLNEIRQIQGYLKFCMRYLSEFFWRHFWDVGTLFPNNFEFLVCLPVCQLAYFLTEIRQIQGYLQFWMSYLYETFSYIPEMLEHYLGPGQIRSGQIRSIQVVQIR